MQFEVNWSRKCSCHRQYASPARLHGVKPETGGRRIPSPLKIHKMTVGSLGKTCKTLKVGATVIFGDGRFDRNCRGKLEHGGRIVPSTTKDLLEVLESAWWNTTSLPIFTKNLLTANVTKPFTPKKMVLCSSSTAGLHFTQNCLRLKAGFTWFSLTPHVNLRN